MVYILLSKLSAEDIVILQDAHIMQHYHISDSKFGEKLTSFIEQKQKDESTAEKKKTIREIANDLEISYQSLLNYQNGRIPKIKVLTKMVEYFNTSFSELLERDKNISIEKSDYLVGISFSEKAIYNARNYSKCKTKEDRESIELINRLLEDKELLKSLKYFIKKMK